MLSNVKKILQCGEESLKAGCHKKTETETECQSKIFIIIYNFISIIFLASSLCVFPKNVRLFGTNSSI